VCVCVYVVFRGTWVCYYDSAHERLFQVISLQVDFVRYFGSWCVDVFYVMLCYVMLCYVMLCFYVLLLVRTTTNTESSRAAAKEKRSNLRLSHHPVYKPSSYHRGPVNLYPTVLWFRFFW